MDGWIVFIIMMCLLTFGVLSIPLLAIWTHHKRKMEEIGLRKQQMLGSNIHADFEALRADVKALRDTTLQYDLSFDSSLQQIERRMAHLEQQNRIKQPADVGITQSVYPRS